MLSLTEGSQVCYVFSATPHHVGEEFATFDHFRHSESKEVAIWTFSEPPSFPLRFCTGFMIRHIRVAFLVL